MKIKLFLACLSLFCLSCDQIENRQTDNILADMKKKVDQLQSQIMNPDYKKFQTLAQGEVDAMFKLEYRVIEFDRNLPASELETELKKVGAERWDCFHSAERYDKLAFFCKRQPLSYIKFMAQMF